MAKHVPFHHVRGRMRYSFDLQQILNSVVVNALDAVAMRAASPSRKMSTPPQTWALPPGSGGGGGPFFLHSQTQGCGLASQPENNRQTRSLDEDSMNKLVTRS